MTLYMRFRLARGLRWEKNRPAVPWGGIVIGLVLLSLILLAGSLDYQIARASAAEQAAEIYSAKAQVLKDCERGATGYYYQDGRSYECAKQL